MLSRRSGRKGVGPAHNRLAIALLVRKARAAGRRWRRRSGSRARAMVAAPTGRGTARRGSWRAPAPRAGVGCSPVSEVRGEQRRFRRARDGSGGAEEGRRVGLHVCKRIVRRARHSRSSKQRLAQNRRLGARRVDLERLALAVEAIVRDEAEALIRRRVGAFGDVRRQPLKSTDPRAAPAARPPSGGSGVRAIRQSVGAPRRSGQGTCSVLGRCRA